MDKDLADLLNGPGPISVVVTHAWYSCCGKAPHERAGYEQAYVGRPRVNDGKLMLVSDGLGTVSYIVVCDVESVVDAAPL